MGRKTNATLIAETLTVVAEEIHESVERMTDLPNDVKSELLELVTLTLQNPLTVSSLSLLFVAAIKKARPVVVSAPCVALSDDPTPPAPAPPVPVPAPIPPPARPSKSQGYKIVASAGLGR